MFLGREIASRRRLEGQCGDGILSSRDLEERAGKSQVPATEFKDTLAGQEMNGVAECLSAPQQPIIKYRIVLPPILVTILFAHGQITNQRLIYCAPTFR